VADLAHDTPGPASRKPGDVALQQASPAASADKGKLRVFISYSRDDLRFADQLNAALNAYGFDSVLDRHGISGGEDWKRRLGILISEADTVVFVLSPISARSEICAWEVKEATRLGKRILPVNCQHLEGTSPPPQLRDRNYIFFYEDQKVSDSGFGTGLAKLVAALNTDFDWLREHTRYLQRAIEWDGGGRPANRLLSGDDIAEAKAWMRRRPKSAPEPTALQLDFIDASEKETAARLRAQRKQLEEMAAAQAEREKALKKAEVAQRKRARVSIALAVTSILAILLAGLAALLVSGSREQDARRADQIAVHEDIVAMLKKDADQGDATSMRYLGWLYEFGSGVPQNYAQARKWYEMAANKGDALAMTTLARFTSTVGAWRRTTPKRASGTRRLPPRATRTLKRNYSNCVRPVRQLGPDAKRRSGRARIVSHPTQTFSRLQRRSGSVLVRQTRSAALTRTARPSGSSSPRSNLALAARSMRRRCCWNACIRPSFVVGRSGSRTSSANLLIPQRTRRSPSFM
jgi:TIR domain/Sel1 repeat